MRALTASSEEEKAIEQLWHFFQNRKEKKVFSILAKKILIMKGIVLVFHRNLL